MLNGRSTSQAVAEVHGDVAGKRKASKLGSARISPQAAFPITALHAQTLCTDALVF